MGLHFLNHKISSITYSQSCVRIQCWKHIKFMHSINIDFFPHQLLKLTTIIVSLIILIQHIDLTSIQFRLTPTPTHTTLCNTPGPCFLTPTYLQTFSFCLRVKKKIILKINKICHISHLIPFSNLTSYLK